MAVTVIVHPALGWSTAHLRPSLRLQSCPTTDTATFLSTATAMASRGTRFLKRFMSTGALTVTLAKRLTYRKRWTWRYPG